MITGSPHPLAVLRARIDALNADFVRLVSERATVAEAIAEAKRAHGLAMHDPEREHAMLCALLAANPGPLQNDVLAGLLTELFSACRSHMEDDGRRRLRVMRAAGASDKHVDVRNARIGAEPVLIAGPCSVESEGQIHTTAAFLRSRGVRWLRGGAYKPRTSPYDFQGLGAPALTWLGEAARAHEMVCISEIVDPRHLDRMCEHVDVLQVGARNMQNFELLKEVGKSKRPVLLKRGLHARIDELLHAAEYVAREGNEAIILCERGIRTFEPLTRNTLDLSAVALLRQMSHLPVLVDVSHAAGRRDILAPLGRAALAVGAQGLMVEVHPLPAAARSDAQQQLDFQQLDAFIDGLDPFFVRERRRAAG
ncbi:MAG: bifunctional 3-deoxy-7-phosphoheptulonate synthase/chorismate mutase [Deltaproteobacteria bacterium]|nr:bifunctional 3-deoxy-7-phosphoheptulonate synthase/chorismate mutase [Deltaproteobacteria bacterium]